MGVNVESSLDVEESTEPPICGYTKPSSKPNVASTLDIRPCAIDEKSISHPSDHPAPVDLPPSREDSDQNAHLINPSELATLLKTDLQYVGPTSTTTSIVNK
jgi:Na+-exporting ATPase